MIESIFLSLFIDDTRHFTCVYTHTHI